METATVFTKFDWYGSAGAECWPNGEEPVKRCIGENWLIIADKNGADAYWSDGVGESQENLQIAFPTQKAAIAFLNGLPDDFSPEEYGFKPY